MSSYSSKKSKYSNSSNSFSSFSSENEKTSDIEKIVQNFILTVFNSAVKHNKEREPNEKEVVSNFINSIIEETKIELITSKFIDSLFRGAFKHVNREKGDTKLVSVHKKEIVPFKIVKQDINYNTEMKSPLRKKGITKDNSAKKQNKSHIKKKRIIISEYNTSNNTFSNTLINDKANNNSNIKSPIKDKRDCSTRKKEKNINKKVDFQNAEFSDQYKAKIESGRERKLFEAKLKIMKNHISAMKRRQEEMDKKISLLKSKEENMINIKRSKAILKKALKSNLNKKVSELIQKRKKNEKQKEALNNGIKESFKKSKLQKIKKYEETRKERKDLSNKIKEINQQKYRNMKNLVEKIRILRNYNKNIVPQMKQKLIQNNQEINVLECEKNMEKTKLLKAQIEELQIEENEFMDKLSATKAKLYKFVPEEDRCFSFLKSDKKGKISSVIC